jgi:WD40 repeat protein
VAFSPDGQFVAAGGDSADATVILWQIETGVVAHKLAGPTASILSMNFRTGDQGQTLVFAYSYDNAYREWNVETGALIRTVTVSNAAVGMTLSPDGRRALASEGNGGALVNVSSWTRLAVNFTPSMQGVRSNTISPNGRLALIGTDAGEVILVSLPVSNEIRRFHAEGGLSTVDISPDGRYLLTGSMRTGTAMLWDIQTGQEVRRLEGLLPAFTSARFSPDGRQALLGSSDAFDGGSAGQAVLWDIATGDIIHEWTEFKYFPRSAAFSPDGRTALVGTLQWGTAWEEEGGGELVLLDLITGKEVWRFEATSAILDISFSPDGRRAVTANSVYGPVTLWDVATGQPVRQFEHFSHSVLFTSNSRYFLTDSGGGFIYLVDAETGANVRVFMGSTSSFWSIAVSPDQQYLLAGGEGGLLVMWNFETGKRSPHFQGHGSSTSTWNVVFSPDGQTAFSSALDKHGHVIEWRIAEWSLNDLLAWIYENRYVRDFTCEERTQYRIEPLCKSS